MERASGVEQSSSRWASPTVALIVGIVALALAIGQLPLDLATHMVDQSVLVLPFGVVGYVIARRQAGNPVGWILIGIAGLFLLSNDAGQYAVLVYRDGHRAWPLGRVAVFLAAWWIWLLVLLPLPIGLFPDGRLSGRWRWVLWAYLIDGAGAIAVATWRDVSGIADKHPVVDSSGELASADATAHGWEALANDLLVPLFVVLSTLWVARQVVAYRGSTGDRRQQLKWLMSGGVIAVLGLLGTLTIKIGFVAIVALPVGLGIGVLKYRLYEIDRIISRTLSYGLLTGLLVGVYVGMVALTTKVLPWSSSVGVAASTLVAAALFTPVRRRIQRRVDRRFNRAKYDSETMLALFAGRLRDSVELDAVRDDIATTVYQALAPAFVGVWIKAGS